MIQKIKNWLINNPGVLVGSGIAAGGALMAVLFPSTKDPWFSLPMVGPVGVSAVVFLLGCFVSVYFLKPDLITQFLRRKFL